MSFFKKWSKKKKEKVKAPGEIKKPARIDKLQAPSKIKEDEILKVIVDGHFSHLGWEMDEATATVHGKEIIVTVVGKKESGMMAAQALKPYSIVVEVKGLKRGKYSIKASKGTSEVLELKVK